MRRAALQRHVILPSSGTLLISTDVHGNGADFDQMIRRFQASPADTHWVILGDIVHGPNDLARRQRPELYDYDDQSGRIAIQIMQLRQKYPGRVHFVLGNHDWAHIGGPVTAKFWPNEASYLESFLEPLQKRAIDTLFREALLCVIAPCGPFLCHASPAHAPSSLEELDAIELGGVLGAAQHRMISEFTTPYIQSEADSRRFLDRVSRLCGHSLTMVIHGHDRSADGLIRREETQICPVIFGATKPQKRVVCLDLGARYETLHELRDGHEIVRLWSRI